jgi:putative phosphonate metabolism protein
MDTCDFRPRYAVYFVPADDHPLFRFGRAVLGYDCYSGEEPAPPPLPGIGPAELAALTREPRVYGFHATLKAPFRLLSPLAESDLMQEFATFVAAQNTIPVIAPCVRTLGAYIAVMARRPCDTLDQLAARCAEQFDRFRAPLASKERERRLAAGLDPTEIANLDRWGYPFVFDAFRFHMTLAGPVPPARRAEILALMGEAFARHCGAAELPVDRLALLRQDTAQARFRVLAQKAFPV